jgi:hypothetical protein
MWTPPWAHSSMALGAFGLAPAADRVLADRVSAAVQANIKAGRPFYDPVPEDFKVKFRQSARGIYNYLIHHNRYLPQALTPEEQKDLVVKVVNKTYYNALRGIGEYRGEASMKNWFYVIARNSMIDELRMFLRAPDGRAKIRKYARDSTNEVTQAAVLRAEAEAATASAEFQLSEQSFKELVRLVREASRVGHDASGNPFISKDDALFLDTFIRARGDDSRTAALLRMDRDQYQLAKDDVTERVGEWASRLRSTLAARGETL